MKKTLDLALCAIALMFVSCAVVLFLQDIVQAEREADVCEAKGQVLIDSSNGRYCFEVPRGK